MKFFVLHLIAFSSLAKHALRLLACSCVLLMLSGTAHAQLFLNVNKSFNPINPNVGQTATLLVSFANTNPTTSATAVSGTDTLPSGLAYVNSGLSGCSFATSVSATYSGGATLNWSSGIIPPNSTCTMTAVVTPFLAGTWVNTIPPNNVSGFIGTTSVSAFSTASATITAGGAYLAITGAKTIPSTVIHGGGTTSYTLVLTNPNALPLSGVGYTDTFPAPMVIAVPGGITSNSCGGTTVNTLSGAIADGDLGFRLNGGAIPPSGSCTIVVVVRTANSTTSQQVSGITNTISAAAVTTTQGITNSAFNVAVRVERGVTLTKAFLPASIVAGGTSLLTITLNNFNLASIPSAGLTDTFPVGVSGVSFVAASAGCGAPTVAVTSPNVVVSNITLGAAPSATANGGTACTVQLVVTAPSAGSFPNSIPAGTLPGGFVYAIANATLTVTNPPGAVGGTKGFTPNSVPQDGTSLLTVTLSNSSLASATSTVFTDNLLSTMGVSITIAVTPAPTNSCGGVLTANPGSTSFSLSGGLIPGTSTCVITLPVVVAGNAAPGLRINTIAAGAVSSSLGTNTAAISGNLTITADISVTKAFNPVTTAQTGSSVLTITLTNAPGGPNAGITSFTDLLSTMGLGITIRAAPAPTNTCGGTLSAVAGSTTISLAGGTIIAGGNCVLTVPVAVAPNAVAGARTNTISAGALVTDQGNNPAAATANLTLVNALSLTKAYSPSTVGPSQVSRLTLTFVHTAGADPFTGMGVTDALPTGHIVATPPNVFTNCGGTASAIAGSVGFSLTGASMPGGANTCIFAVDIQAPAGTGTVANTVPLGGVTTTQGVTNPAAATANLTRSVGTPVSLNKSFTPPNVSGGASSVLSVLITNPNAFALTNIFLSDAMPAGMTVFNIPNASTTCALGLVSAISGANSFSISGATVPASGNCTFQANVTSVTGGNSINTIPVGTLTSAQSVTNQNSPSATLQVLFNLNVGKDFNPVVTQAGNTSLLTVTIYNSNTTTVAGLTTNTLVDLLPSGLVIDNATSSNACGGTVLDSAGGALGSGDLGFRLDGGSFAAGSQCAITVIVRTSPAGATGSFVNNIAPSALNTVGGATNPTPANATVTFLANPTGSKAFNPSSMAAGAVSTLTFTLGNPNSALLLPAGLTSVRYTDTLPAGLSIVIPGPASGTCAGATGNNLSAGQTALVFSGLSIPAAGNCTVAVLVTAPAAGVYANTFTGIVTSQTSVPTTAVGSATLTVLLGPSISKFFSPSAIQSGGTGSSVLTIVVTNPNTTALSMAAPGVLDIFPTSPAAMVASTPLSTATSCVGAVIQNSAGGTLVSGNVGIRLSGGTIPASGSCSVSVSVLMPLAGTYLNTSAPVTTTNAGASAINATATVSVSQVATLTVSKDNGTTTVAAGNTTGYTVTFNNLGPADAAGTTVRDVPSAGLSCTALSCAATGGASCPSLSVPLFLSSGLSLPAFPSGGQVVFSLVCGVTATGL